MSIEKNLLPSQRFIGANAIDTFVNIELSSEKSIIKPFKADNVFNKQEKFNEERNASMKFCLYGMIQSKWCDCDSLKIDFYIADSSTNANLSLSSNTRYPFWVYDKSTNQSAFTWSVQTKRLDDDNGKLSVNLYRKKKGSYFIPFELDLMNLARNPDGILTNKSIYVSITEPSKNAFINDEIPFLFFDDDGEIIEFGQETADILEDGNVIEINNNYPFFYDRHWIRRELIPDGPTYVSFLSQESITITEGGANDRLRSDKLIPVEIVLSEPSKSGLETVKIEVLYGLDEDKKPYTTIQVPSDLLLTQNILRWNFPGENPLKYVYLRLVDDFIIEPQEKVTLKITPIYGCVVDPSKSSILSYYINDNDVPSFVQFTNQFIEFKEPRAIGLPLGSSSSNFYLQEVNIKIDFILDKKVLVPDQYFNVYIDRNETDCDGIFGFLKNGQGSLLTDTRRIYVNENDTSYSTLLSFQGKTTYDKKRQIVLKFSGFTTNLAPFNISTGENKMAIFVNKNIDDNYALINIPYNSSVGKTVVRNVYNAPQSNYDEASTILPTGQRTGTDLTTKMAYVAGSAYGKIDINSSIFVSGFTTQTLASQKNVKSLVEEQEFDLVIYNLGVTDVEFDNNIYENGIASFLNPIIISVKSGLTFSTTTNSVSYDGENIILRLPANEGFITSPSRPVFPEISGLTYSEQFQAAYNNGTLTWSASTFGFQQCNYAIAIGNKSYNYVGTNPNTFSNNDFENFKKTNLLQKNIFSRIRSSTGNISYEGGIKLRAGNDITKRNYYMNTALLNTETRPANPDDLKTGTTLSVVTTEHFYNGVAILPRAGFATATNSRIFISDRKVIDINQITSITSSTKYSFILPTSPIIIPGEISASTLFCPFIFGNLWVQNGYGTITNTSGYFNQTTTTYDGFVAYTSPPGVFSSMGLKSWSTTNPNTKNQAVIEIINTGEIESFFPEGIILKPNERLIISESPMIPTNGGSFFKNLVRPLYPLVLPMSTNSKFNTQREKFLGCSYRISFLNFKIYQPTGVFTNKTVNHSMNFDQLVAPNGTVKPRYLVSIYGDNVFLPYRPFAGVTCNPSTPTQFIRMADTRYKEMYVNGIIITPSTQSPIQQSGFLEFNDLPPNFPGLRASKFDYCCQSQINLGSNLCYWLYD